MTARRALPPLEVPLWREAAAYLVHKQKKLTATSQRGYRAILIELADAYPTFAANRDTT